jgi:hydroxylamine reductase
MYPALRDHPNLAGHLRRRLAETEAPSSSRLHRADPRHDELRPHPEGRQLRRPRLHDQRHVTAFPGAPRIRRRRLLDRRSPAAKAPASRSVENVTGIPDRASTDACCWTQAPTIVEAVKAGKISRFFVIGGCDGAEPGRNYFSDYARATPDDSFILTLGCGKYPHPRPRLRRAPRAAAADGSWASATTPTARSQVALALAKAFDCGVNDLPLTLVISWFEQKAVAVLLTLLALGVKGITVGPNPPAFFTPERRGAPPGEVRPQAAGRERAGGPRGRDGVARRSHGLRWGRSRPRPLTSSRRFAPSAPPAAPGTPAVRATRAAPRAPGPPPPRDP